MQREITGFLEDDEGHWIARLDCGHRRHARHLPPLSERPWVLQPEGRAARIGTPLPCAACERRELPADYEAYQRTPTFTASSVPTGLRSRHTTKAGVWALIHVCRGTLRYRLHAPFDEEQILEAGSGGVVLPGVEHEVDPSEDAEFFVEFHRARGESGPRSA